jgi:hypothetical protein
LEQEETSDVKRFRPYLPLIFAGALSISMASAQSSFDLNIGFGAAQDKASSGLDTGTFLACSPSTDATCAATKSLNGFMLGFGGNLMLWKHFGVGAAVSLQPNKPSYVDLGANPAYGYTASSINSRLTLYDFDGIYQPYHSKKVDFRISGGFGGANLKFYQSASTTTALTGSQSYSQYFGSSNHIQVHGAVGVPIYVTDHIFIRPEFRIYDIHNLYQYGSNLVKEELVWVGYSWGGQ